MSLFFVGVGVLLVYIIYYVDDFYQVGYLKINEIICNFS